MPFSVTTKVSAPNGTRQRRTSSSTNPMRTIVCSRNLPTPRLWFCASSYGEFCVPENAIRLGDSQLGRSARKPASSVALRGFVPSAFITNTCCTPSRDDTNATRVPSGDHAGYEASIPRVDKRCGFPPVASITKVARSAPWLWKNAMSLPSGRQAGQLPSAPPSIQDTEPPRAATRAIQSRCPRRDPKTIVLPSGDHDGPFKVAVPSTSVVASPPAAGIVRNMKSPEVPAGAETYASSRPSGDHAGWLSWRPLCVTRSACEPSAPATNRSLCAEPTLSSRYAMRLPSGEMAAPQSSARGFAIKRICWLPSVLLAYSEVVTGARLSRAPYVT